MYSRKDKLRAIELFIKYDFSPQSVIDELGYPSRFSLYRWYREYLDNGNDIPETGNYRRYDDEAKRLAVDHYFEHGRCLSRTHRALGYPSENLLSAWIDELEPGRRTIKKRTRGITRKAKENAVVHFVTRTKSAQSIADDIGVGLSTLYNWKQELLGEEAPVKIPKKKKEMTIEELEEMKAALEADIEKLELKRAVLERTVELLGKDQSVDPRLLTNREKTILVESMRPAHKLKDLLKEVGLARGSYRYQVMTMARPDKYADLRIRICEIFHESCGRYGYRRIHAALKTEGITASEKVVSRIMAEESLRACRPRKRKYSSYKGEISGAPDNLVKRNFHADAPNTLWLTDITEFSIPAGKIYLSSV